MGFIKPTLPTVDAESWPSKTRLERIRELAPFNTFYAEARKVVIDQGRDGRAQQLADRGVAVLRRLLARRAGRRGSQKVTCPGCGSPGWADVGQKRSLLKLTQVSARST